MKSANRQLLTALKGGVDNADISLGQGQDNPVFKAQTDLLVYKVYGTVASSTITKIASSSLNASLQTGLPFFLFGNSDFASGYKKFREETPVSNTNWTLAEIGVFGRDNFPTLDALTATAFTSLLQRGDMVFIFISSLPGSGTTSIAMVYVRCNTTPYASILDSLNSDKFLINQIRYKIPTTNQDQINQDFTILDVSLFGNTKKDSVSPVAFFSPNQQQANIIDIPLQVEFNKRKGLSSYIDYLSDSLTLSLYIAQTQRV